MHTGFYFDQTRCTGCFTCVVACKDWHDVPAGPASWVRVTTIEKGKCPDVFVAFLAAACYHCPKPACVDACPASSITKRKQDGIVVVDREACLERDKCQLCLESCTYDAPQFGAEENAKMQKCDLCIKRLLTGLKPICVAACPMRALDVGPIDELIRKYGEVREAEGFVYSPKVKPSIIFKAKRRFS
jgi:anaerobic dimethyl sulfoxide reductase subunit B (iron-sulfur subunit)